MVRDSWTPEKTTFDGDRRADAASTEALFVALSDRSRRLILRAFGPPEERTLTTEELVDELVAGLLDRRPDDEGLDRATVATSVHHVHLPKLREVGLVSKASNGYERVERPLVEELLEAVEPYEPGHRSR